LIISGHQNHPSIPIGLRVDAAMLAGYLFALNEIIR